MRKFIVELSEEQRQVLKEVIGSGVAPARKIKHAHILLKSDSSEAGPKWSAAQIQESFGVGEIQVKNVRKRYVEHGLEEALCRRPQPPRPEKRVLNGKHEAYLVALACSPKPDGAEH